MKRFLAVLLSVLLLSLPLCFSASAAEKTLQFRADGTFRLLQINDFQDNHNTNAKSAAFLDAMLDHRTKHRADHRTDDAADHPAVRRRSELRFRQLLGKDQGVLPDNLGFLEESVQMKTTAAAHVGCRFFFMIYAVISSFCSSADC